MRHICYFKWSTYVKVLTLIGVALFFVLPLVLVVTLTNKEYLFMAIIFFIIFIVLLWHMPIGIARTDTELRIIRVFRDIKIPLSTIQNYKRIDKESLRGSIRICASGGMFGYFGLFRNARLGRYRMYTMGLHDLILIQTTKTLYIVSSRDNEVDCG